MSNPPFSNSPHPPNPNVHNHSPNEQMFIHHNISQMEMYFYGLCQQMQGVTVDSIQRQVVDVQQQIDLLKLKGIQKFDEVCILVY